MRIWFAFVGVILWTGIYLTGFSYVSWLLYMPAIGFIFSVITGICPFMVVISKMFAFQHKENFKSVTKEAD